MDVLDNTAAKMLVLIATDGRTIVTSKDPFTFYAYYRMSCEFNSISRAGQTTQCLCHSTTRQQPCKCKLHLFMGCSFPLLLMSLRQEGISWVTATQSCALWLLGYGLPGCVFFVCVTLSLLKFKGNRATRQPMWCPLSSLCMGNPLFSLTVCSPDLSCGSKNVFFNF